MLQSPDSPRFRPQLATLTSKKSKIQKGEKWSLKTWNFLCNMAKITELGLETEDGSLTLLHCGFDTIIFDILQLN